MIILGLTGSLAMGKSTVAGMFRDLSVPVHDADASVHALYSEPQFAEKVDAIFPGVTVDGTVDRTLLSAKVIGNSEALARLEALVHPAVREREEAFIERHRAADEPLVVLDIPLLFETGADDRCTHVAIVSAPEAVQRKRALSRPGMTEEKLTAILARQVPDAQKRKRADFIIDTGQSLEQTRASVNALVEKLTQRR